MNKLLALILSLMMSVSLFGCQSEEDASKNEEVSAPVSSSESEEASEGEKASESEEASKEEPKLEKPVEVTDEGTEKEGMISVAALKGPTGMGLAPMTMDESIADSLALYICASPQEVVPYIAKGNCNMATLPANMGAVLSDKVKVLGINTMGNLTFVAKNMEINDISDLKGKTILASGKGASPEAMLNYILENNDLKPGEDVICEYRSEHAECLAALMQSEQGIALLPQPFATTALMKDESLKQVLNFNELWEKATGGISPVTGIIVAANDYAENHKEEIETFMASYEKAMEKAANADEEAVKAIDELKIAPAAVAKKALPVCGIKLIRGEEMKKTLVSYYEILSDFEPKLIGGKMPSDDFYFLG